MEYQPVIRKYGAEVLEYYKVNLGKDSICCTENHRFWVIGTGWVKTLALKKGDKIYSDVGGTVVEDIEHIKSGAPAIVCNIEVKKNNNYLIADRGILVVDRWPVKNMEHTKK